MSFTIQLSNDNHPFLFLDYLPVSNTRDKSRAPVVYRVPGDHTRTGIFFFAFVQMILVRCFSMTGFFFSLVRYIPNSLTKSPGRDFCT